MYGDDDDEASGGIGRGGSLRIDDVIDQLRRRYYIQEKGSVRSRFFCLFYWFVNVSFPEKKIKKLDHFV